MAVFGSVVTNLSDQNYAQSLASYRFWFNIGQAHQKIPPTKIFDAVWDNRAAGSMVDPGHGKLVHATAHLIVRLASDADSDYIRAPRSGLQNHLYTKSLQGFFSKNVSAASYNEKGWGGFNMVGFFEDANLIAHWANHGYAEEATIRHDILLSLISHQKLYDHQADALIILFKLAGATFEAYADPLVVDRCFELLKEQHSNNRIKRELIKVRAPHAVKGSHLSKTGFRR